MNRWQRWLWRSGLMALGYVVRPYDQVADARRWRWERRAACGRVIYASLTDEDRAALAELARRATADRDSRITNRDVSD